MRGLRVFPLLLLIGLFALPVTQGCAQAPPATQHSVVLSWSAPAAVVGGWTGCGTGTAQCSYAVYAEAITGAACDASTNVNFKEITNSASRPTALTFTDSNSQGQTKCYLVETVQNGANSGSSNIAGPVVVPASPLAPALNSTPTVSTNAPPDLPNAPVPSGTQQLAKVEVTNLVAKVVPVK